MATWESMKRAAVAAEKRTIRYALQREKQLEREAKENAKLSALEQSRLEVEIHENRFEVLLSVHKEQGDTWNWNSVAASLPPHQPTRSSRHELRARRELLVLPPEAQEKARSSIEAAKSKDDDEFREALSNFRDDFRQWEKQDALAHGVRNGELKAFTDVIEAVGRLTEISHFGSSIDFKIHNPRLVECSLSVATSQAIPSEIKTLTSSGKVSIKALPVPRLHEIYQDYVCSCILRVAREVFAILPIDTGLITATSLVVDSATGRTLERPVLSTAITRFQITGLNFESLDPSDAIDSFLHRGEFKASRKAGAFLPIVPLTPSDLGSAAGPMMSKGIGDLIRETELTRKKISDERGELPVSR